jgi:hypothetical protein
MKDQINREKIEDIIQHDTTCGSEASEAMGYEVPCTCGADQKTKTILDILTQAIQEAYWEGIHVMEKESDRAIALTKEEARKEGERSVVEKIRKIRKYDCDEEGCCGKTGLAKIKAFNSALDCLLLEMDKK